MIATRRFAKTVEVSEIEIVVQIVPLPQVPHVKIQEIVQHVPNADIEEVRRQVPELETRTIASTVEVTFVQRGVKIDEIPSVQTQEVVRRVPRLLPVAFTGGQQP